MTMAAKAARRIVCFSHALLRPTATLQGGLATQVHSKFRSSSEKNGEAAVKLEVGDWRVDVCGFVSKTGFRLRQIDLGGGPTADVMLFPSTDFLKQTAILDEESQPIYLDINPHSCTHTNRWETEETIGVARKHVTKLIEAHPLELMITTGVIKSNNLSIKYLTRFCKSGNRVIASQMEYKCVLDLGRYLRDGGHDITYLAVKNNVNNEIRVFQPMEEIGGRCLEKGVFSIDGAQARSKIPFDDGRWNVNWMSISGHKAYGQKGLGVCYIRCRPKVRTCPRISGAGHERGLRCITFTNSPMMGFGEARRITQEGIGVGAPSTPSSLMGEQCDAILVARADIGDYNETIESAKRAFHDILKNNQLEVNYDMVPVTVGNQAGLGLASLPMRMEVLEENNMSLASQIQSLQSQVGDLTLSLEAYTLARHRFVCTFKRDKFGGFTNKDEEFVRGGNGIVHGGDAIADARLYTGNNPRQDYAVYRELYGLPPQVVREFTHAETISVLNTHASVRASQRETGSRRFYHLFAEFVRLFEAGGYDSGYLVGNPTPLSRAYTSFVSCRKSEVKPTRRVV